MSDYSFSIVREIYNNKNGFRTTIGPDTEDFNLIHIIKYDDNNRVVIDIFVTIGEALLIAEAIIKCCEELKK